MAKAVADTDSESNQGGFTYDGSNITGFSSMHDSGTGGSPSLGNFPLFPYASCKNDDPNGCVFPKKSRKQAYKSDSVKSSPGYFDIELVSGVRVEMTASHHTSLFRFHFPSGEESGSPLILLDLSDLSDTRQDNGSISIDRSSGRMTGSAKFLPSFGSGSYTLHFCADFSSSGWLRDSGIFVNTRASNDVHDLTISRSINGYPLPVRSYFGHEILERAAADYRVLTRVVVLFVSNHLLMGLSMLALVLALLAQSRHVLM